MMIIFCFYSLAAPFETKNDIPLEEKQTPPPTNVSFKASTHPSDSDHSPLDDGRQGYLICGIFLPSKTTTKRHFTFYAPPKKRRLSPPSTVVVEEGKTLHKNQHKKHFSEAEKYNKIRHTQFLKMERECAEQ